MKLIASLTLLFASSAMAVPTVVTTHLIGGPLRVNAYIQGQIRTSEYCFKNHLNCTVAIVDSIGVPIQILTTGYTTKQDLFKAISIGFTAASFGENTKSLPQTLIKNPIAKQIDHIYVNGVPLVFAPGGYFEIFKGDAFGIGITLTKPPENIAVQKQLDTIAKLFNKTYYNYVKHKLAPYNLKTFAGISPGLMHTKSFQKYLASIKTIQHCESQDFACAIATSDTKGTIKTLLSSIRVLPIMTMHSIQRASLSALTGTNHFYPKYMPYQPGSPLMQNGKISGGVGATTINVSHKAVPWQNYSRIYEQKFQQNLQHIEAQEGT